MSSGRAHFSPRLLTHRAKEEVHVQVVAFLLLPPRCPLCLSFAPSGSLSLALPVLWYLWLVVIQVPHPPSQYNTTPHDGRYHDIHPSQPGRFPHLEVPSLLYEQLSLVGIMSPPNRTKGSGHPDRDKETKKPGIFSRSQREGRQTGGPQR